MLGGGGWPCHPRYEGEGTSASLRAVLGDWYLDAWLPTSPGPATEFAEWGGKSTPGEVGVSLRGGAALWRHVV